MRYAVAVKRRITMRVFLLAALCALFIRTGALDLTAQNQIALTKGRSMRGPLPDWAYPINPPTDESSSSAETPDTIPRRVTDSTAAFTPAQTKDLFNVPDWHPADHPA